VVDCDDGADTDCPTADHEKLVSGTPLVALTE
jgi:hypothetical protein